jgi:GR25 family glycosyltransferase involved in LPS biosynthesis
VDRQAFDDAAQHFRIQRGDKDTLQKIQADAVITQHAQNGHRVLLAELGCFSAHYDVIQVNDATFEKEVREEG